MLCADMGRGGLLLEGGGGRGSETGNVGTSWIRKRMMIRTWSLYLAASCSPSSVSEIQLILLGRETQGADWAARPGGGDWLYTGIQY